MLPLVDPLQTETNPPAASRLPAGLLEGILTTSVAAIVVLDDQGQIIFANDAAEQILGIPTAVTVQRTYNAPQWQITDFDGNPLPEQELPFVRVMQTGDAVFDVRHAIAWENRERRYLSINGAPLKDASGRVVQVVCSVTDITEQIHSQQIQDEALGFYRQTFEANSAIKLLIDPATGLIVDANPAAVQFYGYPLDVLQQMKITDINQLPASLVRSNMEQTCSQETGRWYFPHRLASGEIRQVEVHSSRLQLQGRELLYSVIHDVTDRQQFEHALKLQVKQEQLLEEVTQTIRQSLELNAVLQTTVDEVRQLLAADRVMIYRAMESSATGSIVVESCSPDYAPLLGWEVGGTNTEPQQFVQTFQQLANQSITDIAQSRLDPAYVQLLETFAVKSQLTIPIVHTTGIWGLLMIQQCGSNRQWQEWEISILQRLETQLVVAIQQAELYQQVQTLNTNLESQVRQRTTQLQKTLRSEAVSRRITEKIHNTLNEKFILQIAVRELGVALNLNGCYASLYDLDQKIATVHYEYTDSGASLKGRITTLEDYPEIYQLLCQGESLQFCLPVASDHSKLRSVLYYPILDDIQGILGDLKLVFDPERVLDQQELQLVRQVTQQCAIAIRQSRLYQSAQAQIRELEKLNRLKDDFLNTTSHELRTPLSSIRMSIQLMEVLLKQSGEPLSPKLERCLNVLREECDREINLINDLLLLQQLNAGTHPFSPGIVCLQDWLLQVIDLFGEKFNSDQQTCQIDIAANLPCITTDPILFDRVFHELLMNAHKFAPSGETITVTVQPVTEGKDSHKARYPIQITVANTGSELPAHELPHIFEQFYRVPSNDPWKHGGTGLGLALVKKIVDFLGGSIAATSHAGRTCFTVQLPLHAKPM